MARIALIGMPGAGKTTVGKSLAKALSLRFFDTDRELVSRTGVSVATIFEIEGEAGFRRREAALIAELLLQDGLVLATGGGSILNAQTRISMKEAAVVIYLRASLEALAERTQKDTSRPLLSGNNRDKLRELLAAREPLYQETAHFTFDTGRQSPAKLAASIAKALNQAAECCRPSQP
jgi:shikimate kinase